MPTTEPHESVIDVQRQHWSPLAVVVAQAIGDRHAYDLFESQTVLTAIPDGIVCYLDG